MKYASHKPKPPSHLNNSVTNVVQVTIHHQPPQVVTLEHIRLLFHQLNNPYIRDRFGEITRMKIGSRNQLQTTALVEFESRETCLNLLSQRFPNVTVTPMKIERVTLLPEDEGIDYTNEEDQQYMYIQDMANFFDPFRTQDTTPSSRKSLESNCQPTESQFSTMTQLKCDESFQVLQKDLDRVFLNDPMAPFPMPLQQPLFLPTNFTPVNQHEPPSQIISLKGEFSLCQARHIYNLFSNFGNISRIFLVRYTYFKQWTSILNTTLIEYETLDYAKTALQMCNGIILFNQRISISFSNRQAILGLDQFKNLLPPEDIFVGSQATNRLPRQQIFQQVQAPSNTIHVSNLKYQTSNPDTMWDLFTNFGIVEAVKVLNTQQKFMCMVKMESIHEAITIVACMHNYLLEGRNMQISFTQQVI